MSKHDWDKLFADWNVWRSPVGITLAAKKTNDSIYFKAWQSIFGLKLISITGNGAADYISYLNYWDKRSLFRYVKKKLRKEVHIKRMAAKAKLARLGDTKDE